MSNDRGAWIQTPVLATKAEQILLSVALPNPNTAIDPKKKKPKAHADVAEGSLVQRFQSGISWASHSKCRL